MLKAPGNPSRVMHIGITEFNNCGPSPTFWTKKVVLYFKGLMLGEEDTWTVKFAKPGPYVFGMWVIPMSEENSCSLLPYVAMKPSQIIFISFSQDVGVKTQSKSCRYSLLPRHYLVPWEGSMLRSLSNTLWNRSQIQNRLKATEGQVTELQRHLE